MITLVHSDCLDPQNGLAVWPDLTFDCAITDPPYSERTQNKHRVGGNGGKPSRPKEIGFAPLTDEVREGVAYHFARLVRRWVLVFTDDRGIQPWADALQANGLEWIRTIVWIKVAGTPQFTGDRPANGAEYIMLAHRRGSKIWNGGGKAGVYWYRPVRGQAKNPRLHDAQKPILLMSELVKDFTLPGESVLDPFAGAGTTLMSCKRHGRDAIGYESDFEIAEVARRRLECEVVSEPTVERKGARGE